MSATNNAEEGKEPSRFAGIDVLTTLMLPFAATYLFLFFVVEDAPVKMLAAIQVDGEQWYADQRAPWEHSFTMFLGFSVAYLLFRRTNIPDPDVKKNATAPSTGKEDDIEKKVKVR
jgi:hypothetical protein